MSVLFTRIAVTGYDIIILGDVKMKKIKQLFFLVGALISLFVLNGCTQTTDNATVLHVEKGVPNPNGHIEEVYLLSGELSENGGVVVLDETASSLPTFNEKAAKTLRVFHFNDMHGNLVKYNDKGNTHAFAQMVKRVKDANAAAGPEEAVLFLSAGDDHIGSIFDELTGSIPEEFIQSASYEAYSAGGLDFALVGNHELDKQSEIFKLSIENNALFPVLSANIVGSSMDIPYYPAAIAVTKGLRIGIIGVTTPKEVSLHTVTDSTLSAFSPEHALEQLVPAMAPYCDVFVVMSHNGFDKETDRYTLEYGDSNIAEQMGNITDLPTVIVGGHTHSVLNKEGLEEANIINGVPVVQAGQHGEYLGEMSLTHGDTPLFTAVLHPILPGTSTNPDVVLETKDDYDVVFQNTIIDPIREVLNVKLQEVIATTGDTALITDEVTVIERYIGECALANFMNDAMVAQSAKLPFGQVDFAFFNGTGMRGLPANANITVEDMYKLMPYADTLYTVTMTGADIQSIVNSGAKRLYRESDFTPAGGPLDPIGFNERGVINFSSGVRFTVIQGQTPEANTVEGLTLDGENIEDVLDKEYTVLLSSYLANGRGGWNGESIGQGLPDNIIGYDLKSLVIEKGHDSGIVYRNELINFIRDAGVVDESTGLLKDGRIVVQ